MAYIVCDRLQNGASMGKGQWSYLRCGSCGLLTSDPIPTSQQIEDHYRTTFHTGNYETLRRYALQYRHVYEEMANWVAPKQGEGMLDVGCLTGNAYGLELQAEAVQIAQERMPGRIFQADVQGSTFPPGPYDAIAMMGLIEHVVDPQNFIRRAGSMLAPNGRLLLQIPDASSVLARTMRSHWPPLAPIEHIHCSRELRCGDYSMILVLRM